MPKSSASLGKVRIIAGQWRGRKLDVIDCPGLRPTPDRVRETLFNWIQEGIVGAHCLDLFAGTGALGFEALSRHAAKVTFVESNPKLVELLKHHAESLSSEKHIVQFADALNWLQQGVEAFDYIFLDPPFGEAYIEKCCAIIREESLLKAKGMVYIESEKGVNVPEAWKIIKQTKAGNVQAMLIQEQ